MTSWLFDSNLEGWSMTAGNAPAIAWNGANGSPFPGCIFADGSVTPFKYLEVSLTGLSIPVLIGDPLSFRVRLTGSNPGGNCAFPVYNGGFLGSAFNASNPPFVGGDTGWVEVTGTISSNGTVAAVYLRVGTPLGIDTLTGVYLDSIYLAESPPGGPFDLARSAGGIPGSVMVVS